MVKEEMDFIQACNWLADRFDLPRLATQQMSPEEREAYEAQLADRRLIFDILTEAAHFYHNSLLADSEMLDHLRNHYGLSDETIKTYLIGYSTGEGLYDHLKDKGYEGDILRTGLFVMVKLQGLKEFFQHRIVFPYWNGGKVVYFAGRKTDRTPDVEWENGKYKKLPIHSKEGNSVSEHITNSWFFGEDSTRGAKNIYVAEGITDCLTMLQAGYPTISPGTTRFNNKDLPRLEKLTSKANAIYLVPDAEESKAGIKGAMDTGQKIEDFGRSVYIVTLPREEGTEKVDAADFLKANGKDALQALVDEAKTPLQLEIDAIETEGINNVQLLDRLSPVLERLKSLPSARRKAHLDYLKDTLQLSTETYSGVKEELKSAIKLAAGTSHKDGKAKYSAHFDGLVDLALQEGKLSYIVNMANEPLVFDEWVGEDGETRLLPPPSLEQVPFDLLPAEMVLNKFQDFSVISLYRDVVKRLKEVAILPSENHYHLCAVYIFFTYLKDQVPYYPYLWFFGLPERGKSRITKAVIRLSYRGFYSETLTAANIIRFADLFGGTLALDVFDVSKKVQKNESYDLLLGRFENGMKVARVVAPDKGQFQDSKYYKVWGPTLFATNKEIPAEDPLRSRCIKVVMPEARGIYPNNTSFEDLMDLKAGLLAFRTLHILRTLPDVEKPVAGRLGDLMQPLLAVAALLPKEANDNLRALISELENDRRQSEADSMAGRITQVLFDLQEEFRNGRLAVEKVREKLNEDTPNDRFHLSPQRVGKELAAMSVVRTKVGGTMHILWDEDVMVQLFDRFRPYGYTLPTLPTLQDDCLELNDREEGEIVLSPHSPEEDENPWA